MGIRVTRTAIAAATAMALAVPHAAAWADAAEFTRAPGSAGGGMDGDGRELPPYLQCVPYARERTGVQIFGDARTWWDQAAGRYRRGAVPKAGAVMTFQPAGPMTLGHVAAVARVIDSRTVLLDHANWSPINGRRGQIERGVRAVDVSPANDWSMVRVWYDPLQALGTTAWPVLGFIYNERPGRDQWRSDPPPGGQRTLAGTTSAHPAPALATAPSRAFSAAFADFAARPAAAKPRTVAAVTRSRPIGAPAIARDPIGAAIARYER